MLISEFETLLNNNFNNNKAIYDFKLNVIKTIKSMDYLIDISSINFNCSNFYADSYEEFISLKNFNKISSIDKLQNKNIVINCLFNKYKFNCILVFRYKEEISFRAAYKKNNVIFYSSAQDPKNTKYTLSLSADNELLTNEWPQWNKSCLAKLEPIVWKHIQDVFAHKIDSILLPKRFLKYKIFT